MLLIPVKKLAGIKMTAFFIYAEIKNVEFLTVMAFREIQAG